MAYIGIDNNTDNNDPSQNFSTGSGGNTDWAGYFKNYFDQQQGQQGQGQQQQGNGGGTLRDGYGFNNTGNPYPQYNQPSQVGQAGNPPTWPTNGFPTSYGQDMGNMNGSNQITGFLGPYNQQMRNSIDRYSASLPQPGSVAPRMAMGDYPPMNNASPGGSGGYPTGSVNQPPAADAGYPHSNSPTNTVPNWLDLLRGQGSHAPGEPAIGSPQATAMSNPTGTGQPTIGNTATLNGVPVGPTGLPVGSSGSGGGGGGVPGQTPITKTAAQYAAEPQFQQALEANIAHPGWNYGEAGAAGTPDFVRHPQSDSDWQARFYYFQQHPEQAMPDWKPVNQYYQQNDPKAIANLQALASGQAHDPYMTAAGAASQLSQWGVQGQGQMEPGNPQNPMGILHKDGMRYDVATGKNLGPDMLPRPAYSSGGGYAPRGSTYAPRTTYSSGGGSKALPPPAANKPAPLGPNNWMQPVTYNPNGPRPTTPVNKAIAGFLGDVFPASNRYRNMSQVGQGYYNSGQVAPTYGGGGYGGNTFFTQ